MGKFRMDEKTFGTIKKLLGAGMTRQEITDITGVNRMNISIVKQSRDLEEYKAIVNEKTRKVKEAKETSPGGEPIAEDLKLPGGKLSGAYTTNRIITLLEKNNELLTLLSEKLAFIVEQLQ